jgi:hypothetical protein
MAKKGSTKTRKLPEVQQSSLLDVEPSPAPAREGRDEPVRFDRGDRARLFIGAVRLEKYLRDDGLKWVLRLAAVLDELSWKAFEASYKPGGRPPLHPSRVVGLIIYGLMLKQTSLRQLESLGRRDVGAWWITGGLTPDFTTVTKFIQRHEQLLTEDFFRETTALIAKRLNLTTGDLVFDGTVVQAAASTGGALTREALKERLEDAKAFGDTETVAKLEAASGALAVREQEREAAGKPGNPVVSPEDPEAVLQPKKNSDDFRLAMKPVIAAHPSGLIVGQTVTPSSETAAVPKLLEQHEQIFGVQPQRVLADAGFVSLLGFFFAKGIEPLIPSGRDIGQRSSRNGLFAKSAFAWDDEAKSYRCPAQKLMSGGKKVRLDDRGRAHRLFEGVGCADCPLLSKCTQGKSKRRSIKRYEADELKEAMALVLSQPSAQRAYRRRAAIVEPVFARLRQNGLTRFRRRGTRRARLEFALACVAHNFQLLLWSRRGVFVAVAIGRRPDASWGVVALAVAFRQD